MAERSPEEIARLQQSRDQRMIEQVRKDGAEIKDDKVTLTESGMDKEMDAARKEMLYEKDPEYKEVEDTLQALERLARKFNEACQFDGLGDESKMAEMIAILDELANNQSVYSGKLNEQISATQSQFKKLVDLYAQQRETSDNDDLLPEQKISALRAIDTQIKEADSEVRKFKVTTRDALSDAQNRLIKIRNGLLIKHQGDQS